LITRRRLLQYGSAIGAFAGARLTAASLNLESIAKFVDPLPVPPIAKSQGMKPVRGRPSVQANHYRIAMREISAKLHRDLPPARLWGYNGSVPGPTFEMRRGEGAYIEWVNELPSKHFLPIDYRLHGAERGKPQVRAVTHVHGATVAPADDGYPENWYVPGKSATCYYPNQQEAAMLWYHDHAMGINRLNVYAGLFGVFIVRDQEEDALNLPRGAYEIPLIICDRQLTKDGQLDYPTSGDPDAPWVPEVFGEAFLANGKLFPFLEVEPRRYRFRIVNVSNGRFLNLFFSNRLTIRQIGTDQGLLPAPVAIDRLLLAPGERGDIVVDFAPFAGGEMLLNDGSFDLMQIRVAKGRKGDDTSDLPATLRPFVKAPESAAARTRELYLMEEVNLVAEPVTMLLNGAHWDMPVTEKPVLDSVEIWSFINATEDTHPIHLHLVRFQILDRRRFDASDYRSTGKVRYTGPVQQPSPSESGWKDTVRADSRMVTRIIVKFEGYIGRYVWHCHVLEHEDNEMMRPFEIVPASVKEFLLNRDRKTGASPA
jgi:spore coat protein A